MRIPTDPISTQANLDAATARGAAVGREMRRLDERGDQDRSADASRQGQTLVAALEFTLVTKANAIDVDVVAERLAIAAG